MIFNMVGVGGGGGSSFPSFTYSGNYQYIDDGDGDWRIKFLTSGTFRITSQHEIDVFCVGGGGGAGYGNQSYATGGGGGYTNTLLNVIAQAETDYPIVIGAGGAGATSKTNGANGTASTAFGLTASGGGGGIYTADAGGSGGSGGKGYGNIAVRAQDGADNTGNRGGKGQISTPGPYGETGNTREFGEANATLYSDGGYLANIDAIPNTGNGGNARVAAPAAV